MIERPVTAGRFRMLNATLDATGDAWCRRAIGTILATLVDIWTKARRLRAWRTKTGLNPNGPKSSMQDMAQAVCVLLTGVAVETVGPFIREALWWTRLVAGDR